MAIKLTDSACRKLLGTMTDTKAPAGTVARLSVKGGGCAGFSYVLDFESAPKQAMDTEFTFDVDGTKLQVRVDPKSYLMVNGTEIDFHSTLMEQHFVFNNPLAKGTCGCGSSFAM